ncbi:MAG: Fic family protein [Immundisolibacterales bacterium]|nr:Fic family protein [Immundisolibacterales bacterium]
MSFVPSGIEAMPIGFRLLRIVREISKYRGRQDLFRQQSPQVLESLRQVALIQSTESSNRIDGVTAPVARIRSLVEGTTAAQNRSEQEIAGNRDVLGTIHANAADIPFTANVVLQLHRDLYQFLPGEGGYWKRADNEIVETGPDGVRVVRFRPVAAHRTSDAMERLHDRFNDRWQAREIDPLLLIPVYVLDFLCIHPFHDGNGRMARLLTTLLLYQAGQDVCRYISLEQIVERTRESYYDSLQRSSFDWHEGRHDLTPRVEYLLGVVILGAWQELERRTGIVQGGRGAKTAMVLDVIDHLVGDFSVSELHARCPTVGIDLVRSVLRQQRDDGQLECLGRGPRARWRRIG